MLLKYAINLKNIKRRKLLDKLPIVHSSTEVKNFLKAFAKAQLEFKVVHRSQKGHYGDYADINDINNATRTALNKNGISVMQ